MFSMNRLPTAKRAQILQMLCEGISIRATSRLADVSVNTVSKLLVDAGALCRAFHDEMVRGVNAKRVQADETWAFRGGMPRNETLGLPEQNAAVGDVWTHTAIDADSKLVIAYLVGARDGFCAELLIRDVESRILADRTRLTTDQLNVYMRAVDLAFKGSVDYAMLHKAYEGASDGRHYLSECEGTKRVVVAGDPDPKHISTSCVEQADLTMRMHMRRFTLLTNVFSRKFENHAHMVAIYTLWHNWVRIHRALRVTPAMEAKLTDHVWSLPDIVEVMEAVNDRSQDHPETLPPQPLRYDLG